MSHFYEHCCFAPRPSLQHSNILPSLMPRPKISFSIFTQCAIIDSTLALKTSFQFANIFDATPQNHLKFPTFYHHWCYALRSSPQLLNITDATLRDLLFNLLSFYHHRCFAQRCSLHNLFHSTIVDAMLEDFLFNFPTSVMLRSKICFAVSTFTDVSLWDHLINFLLLFMLRSEISFLSNVLPSLMLRSTIILSIY
jgi:hypothetical protein